MNQDPLHVRSFGGEAFDMTPIIDVVFLLIIFFMLVCQFIVAENFQIEVPDEIATARENPAGQNLMTTVTVMTDSQGRVCYAVGSEILSVPTVSEVPERIAAAIDTQLRLLKPDRRVVRLRCQKDLPFAVTKQALKGISQSSAADVQWAVFRGR